MSEIELLQNEVDRGSQVLASFKLVRHLNMRWAPYGAAHIVRFGPRYGWKTHVRRAGRLLFFSYVVGRGLATSKDLMTGEARRIVRWLDGEHPSPEIMHFAQADQWVEKRIVEVADWLEDRRDTVLSMANLYRAGRMWHG